MVTGRFVVGLGVGLASCIVPLYIGELSPTKIRGKLVTINAVAVTLGQVVAYRKLTYRCGRGRADGYDVSHWDWLPARPRRLEVDGGIWRCASYRTALIPRCSPRIPYVTPHGISPSASSTDAPRLDL